MMEPPPGDFQGILVLPVVIARMRNCQVMTSAGLTLSGTRISHNSTSSPFTLSQSNSPASTSSSMRTAPAGGLYAQFWSTPSFFPSPVDDFCFPLSFDFFEVFLTEIVGSGVADDREDPDADGDGEDITFWRVSFPIETSRYINNHQLTSA
jgi:hypothetical protein